jgi:hypothetical protein
MTARRGVAREPTPERSPLSGRASRRGRRRCYSGRGGAKDGTQAPTVERLPAGHGDGGDSSPELLVDGEGEKNRIGGGVLRRGEGSGGRRRCWVGVEGEGARLNIPWKKKWQEGARVPLTVKELATAETSEQRRWRARTATAAPDTDDGAVGMSACGARRGDGVARIAGVRSGRLSGRRRAVPTAPLRRASGVAWHGRVTATRRRRADR